MKPSVHFSMHEACNQVVFSETVEDVAPRVQGLGWYLVWLAMWLPVRQQIRFQMPKEWNA